MQEVVDEAAAEETNEHTQGKKINNKNINPGKQKSLYIQRQRSNLAQRGTQQQLRGETENRRWSAREKQKERKKQRFEGGVRERKREIGNRYVSSF